MAKNKKPEKTGFSLQVLIRQSLMDGKAHSLNDIVKYIEQFMHSASSLIAQIQLMLQSNQDIEKTRSGFKLRSGATMNDLAAKILASADSPLTSNELIKKIARQEGVPAETVELKLDSDSRFKTTGGKGKTAYYLATRKSVNDKVLEILKAKAKPVPLTEIYKILEKEMGCDRSEIIFLPKDSAKFQRIPGQGYSLKSAKAKRAAPAPQEKPMHNVTPGEVARVVDHLRFCGERLTASQISETVLGMSIERTNLILKLNKERQLKRENEFYFYFEEPTATEIPPKIRETVNQNYIRVKGMMLGKREIYTVDGILDRIFKINITHDDYDFYLDLLESHLENDESLVRTMDGWIHINYDSRASFISPVEFSPAIPIEPAPPKLDIQVLTPAEQNFLSLEVESFDAGIEIPKSITHRVVPSEREYGVLQLHPHQLRLFPSKPQFYEITIVAETDGIPHTCFVNRKLNKILDVKPLFDTILGVWGGRIEMVRMPDSDTRFLIRSIELGEQVDISAERMSQLDDLASHDWTVPTLLQRVFIDNPSQSLSLAELYYQINAVRSVTRRELLETLKDFRCFVEEKDVQGQYRFNPEFGLSRVSSEAEAVQMTEKPGQESEIAEVQTSATTTPDSAAPQSKPPELHPAETVETAAPPAQPKKKEKKRRPVEEEIPEHLRRLKSFEHRLPGLESVRSLVVKPSEHDRGSRIGAVSAGRIDVPETVARPKRPSDDEPSLLKPTPISDAPQEWSPGQFVNPERGAGYTDLHMALEVLKTFVSRPPQIRKTDGSIVLFLDSNDVSIYFRVPPENMNCWMAWIPDDDLNAIKNSGSFIQEGDARAKYSAKGYWWATEKFKGPKGNWKDRNVLEGVQIIAKILDLMDKPRK